MKFIFFLWCFAIIFFLGFLVTKYSSQHMVKHVVSPMPHIVAATRQHAQNEKTSLFIPYWSLPEKIGDNLKYDRVIYFGIIPNTNGVDTTGDGYKNIANFFLHINANSEKLLTVQMTDTQLNTTVLKDTNLQEKIILQSLAIAKQNGFDGIVLDFEISALPFASVTDSITGFSNQFVQKAHEDKLKFFISLYGDSFYRIRPYNISAITQQADGIMIMAYDFHKAKGDPGANFPLSSTKDEDYSFKLMIRDYLKSVPIAKISVIFGMFGYDWKVNGKGQSIASAQSISLSEIKQKFLDNCRFTDCKIKHDNISSETEITYIDPDNRAHDVWFEDMQSVAAKKAFLQSNGIFSTGLWAYSYF